MEDDINLIPWYREPSPYGERSDSGATHLIPNVNKSGGKLVGKLKNIFSRSVPEKEISRSRAKRAKRASLQQEGR